MIDTTIELVVPGHWETLSCRGRKPSRSRTCIAGNFRFKLWFQKIFHELEKHELILCAIKINTEKPQLSRNLSITFTLDTVKWKKKTTTWFHQVKHRQVNLCCRNGLNRFQNPLVDQISSWIMNRSLFLLVRFEDLLLQEFPHQAEITHHSAGKNKFSYNILYFKSIPPAPSSGRQHVEPGICCASLWCAIRPYDRSCVVV